MTPEELRVLTVERSGGKAGFSRVSSICCNSTELCTAFLLEATAIAVAVTISGVFNGFSSGLFMNRIEKPHTRLRIVQGTDAALNKARELNVTVKTAHEACSGLREWK
jgi:hypothetical protein